MTDSNIHDATFARLKQMFDDTLNKQQSTFKTSNDEPTPIGCIQEILAKIPVEIWSNPDARIYDPCCGNGNWHLVAWDMIKRASGRDDASITKMFHFNDTNHDRLANVRNVFRDEMHALNITSHDFLEHQDNNRYDLIMANPPYARIMPDGKRASKNHTMIRDFLTKSLELLNDDGFLAYLIPDNWMSLADRNVIVMELTKFQFVHLNIHDAKRWFPKIGSSFTWFVLKKCPATEPFDVEGTYMKTAFKGMVASQHRDYIPLIYTETVRSILNKTIDRDDIPRFKVETSSDLHKYTNRDLISSMKDDKHPYKLIHTPKQTVYATRPHKFQEGFKVFISATDKYGTFVDECGMTQSIAFVRCASEDEAKEHKRVLDHPLYKFLNDICRWGNFNNIRILQRFPLPEDKDDIYGSFGIDEEEKAFIEKVTVK